MTRGFGAREVTVVGGGLVGSLLAIYLGRRGVRVTVFERRPDPRSAGAPGGRSINLVVAARGLAALERVGLAEAAKTLTVPVTGRMVHSLEGKRSYQPYGRDESECNHSVSRAELNRFLIDEAEARGARFRFGQRLAAADFARGVLRFADEASGRERDVEAALVFGADGATSAVRAALVGAGLVEEAVEPLGYGYKELTIPAGSDGAPRAEPRVLHVWPRGAVMLMALPNPDASFTVTLYLPEGRPAGFAAVRSAPEVRALFEREFPDAIPLIPDLEGEFLSNPTGGLGTVRCRPWCHAGRALLIGDAAHAIVPFFGQGMNCGFEDCRVLDDLLDEGLAPDELFARFDAERKPDADAIAEMALDNFIEMRDRVGDRRFLLRKQVEHRLERELPSEYRSRYSLVMYGARIPYRVAAEAGRIEDALLEELCAGVGSAAEVDLERARRMVRERLTPYLERVGADLDY